MNNQNKAYSLIIYFIWPFSAILIGIKNFGSLFGRKLLIAGFVFLGYTSIESGDFERYAANYYKVSDNKLSNLIDLFINLQVGKFFNDFTAVLFSIFNNHHIYFAFLFGFFGYFLVNSLNLLRININLKPEFSVTIGFIALAFFYSILTIYNYAFYMGGIYFLYFLLRIILTNNKRKNYIFISLTPFFHIGLVPVLLIPIVYSIFREKTKWYILLLVFTTAMSQSYFVNKLESTISDSGTVLDKKFKTYASDSGRESLETRYEEGYEMGNFNYKLSRDARKWSNNIAMPILLIFLFLNREKFREDKESFNLLNVSIACLSITNLMLNISQGERFHYISGFMILSAYAYYIQKKSYDTLKYRFLLFLCIPLILFTNLINLIIAKNFMSIDFLISNFPAELVDLL